LQQYDKTKRLKGEKYETRYKVVQSSQKNISFNKKQVNYPLSAITSKLPIERN